MSAPEEGFYRALAIGPAESFILDTLCRPITDAFGDCYLVGSVLTRRDPRDIDIRCMVDDDDPLAVPSERRRVLSSFISEALRAATGLRVDFQFQGTTEGNREPGRRSALGLGYAWRQATP